ncbi:acid-sensing ion channel 2-like [Clytia hemisphaerica]|uniref:Uncharacterized protein n=2 Tax=Clytia hemisphaerica TaxID=252671 RepID=A0A7M5WKK5_9CNID
MVTSARKQSLITSSASVLVKKATKIIQVKSIDSNMENLDKRRLSSINEDTEKEKQYKMEEQKQNSPSRFGRRSDEGLVYLWKNFASNTTAHGFSNILMSSHISIRLLWIAVIIVCQVLLYLQINPLVIRFFQKPTKTKLYLQEESSQVFPVITLCNTNGIKQSQMINLLAHEQFSDIAEELETKKRRKRAARAPKQGANRSFTKDNWKPPPKTTEDEDSEDYFEVDEADIKEYAMKMRILSRLGNIAQDEKEEIFKYGYTKDDMIIECKWKDYYNCKADRWWKPVWHWRYGNCYSFNVPDQSINKTVLKVTGAGPDHGLKVKLDLHQEEYLTDYLTETAGIVLHIGEQGGRVEPYSDGFNLAPNFAHYLTLSKTKVVRADPFNNGTCVQHSRRDLGNRSFSNQFISKYSVHACREICLARKQLNHCGCSSYWLPSLNGSRTCDENDMTCADTYWQQAIEGKLDCLADCRQPCNEVKYEIESSFRKYPIKMKETDKKLKEENEDEQLQLLVSFKTLETKVIEDEEYYFLENLLGDIGGQLGLFSGISALTCIELLFFLVNTIVVISTTVRWYCCYIPAKKGSVQNFDMNSNFKS